MNNISEDDFDTWLEARNIIDSHSFETSGGVVWLSNGVRVKDAFCGMVSEVFSAGGFNRVELPSLIPHDIYTRQVQHYEGLRPLTYSVVSSDGSTALFLRTTSETPFTYLFRGWMTRYGLPLRCFQIVTVFRHEASSRVRHVLRAREIVPFIESYSAYSNVEGANAQVLAETQLYQKILDNMCIPYLLTRRPMYDTFPEARYTMAFDVILPNGSVYQIATVHHLGDSFGRAFDVRVDSGAYIWQTSTGISGRAIGCMLSMHRDAVGVVLPYAASPYQIAITTAHPAHTGKGRDLIDKLVALQVVNPDCVSICDKCNRHKWFGQGGCLEVAVNTDSGVITCRNGKTIHAHASHLVESIQAAIGSHTEWLRKRAHSVMCEHLSEMPMKAAREQGYRGVVFSSHCGEESCMERTQEALSGQGKILGVMETISATHGVCEFCRKSAATRVAIAMGSDVDYH